MLVTKRVSQHKIVGLNVAAIFGAQSIEWYAGEEKLWIRYDYDRGQTHFTNVPEDKIRKLMNRFAEYSLEERRKGFIPDRRILHWTKR